MIKNILKRYWIFLLLLIVNVVIGLIFPEIGKRSLEISKQNIDIATINVVIIANIYNFTFIIILLGVWM